MIDLSYRHRTAELMDRDDIPFDDMAQTLKELNIINTRLGGHRITLAGVRGLMQRAGTAAGKPAASGSGHRTRDRAKPAAADASALHICEIGCGGGDNLRAIHRLLSPETKIRFTGIDISPECIRFATERNEHLDATWICSDYAAVKFGTDRPDIMFNSLFCHHFGDEELVSMLQWMQGNASAGFFINDLQRHWLAYYLIRYITRIFSRSYLVKNDACLSVARSFRKRDWERLFAQASITHPQIRWRWAFRYLVSV